MWRIIIDLEDETQVNDILGFLTRGELSGELDFPFGTTIQEKEDEHSKPRRVPHGKI
jgi:hypothetical protein